MHERQSIQNLTELLRRAAQHRMTPEEIAAQRRSFARAEAGFGGDKDEAAYREALAAGDKAALARLEAESREKIKHAEALADG